MPSLLHQALVRLFQERPSLLRDLLPGRVELLPEGAYADASGDLTTITPTELRADLVIRLSHGGRQRMSFVVEVQLSPDERKRGSWPGYLANLHARDGCEVLLVVVTPHRSVARWAANPIVLGPGFVLTPTVLGPDAIPAITTLDDAAESPELAVLSSLAHPERVDVAVTAMCAAKGLDDRRAGVCADILMACSAPAVRAALETLMTGRYEFQSDFAKKYVAIGREEGREEGLEHGLARALLTVLASRGLEIDDESRDRILQTHDVVSLETWLQRASSAASVAEVFAD